MVGKGCYWRGGKGGLLLFYTFRSSKVNDVSIFLEHVDLLYSLNGLDIELLERGL